MFSKELHPHKRSRRYFFQNLAGLTSLAYAQNLLGWTANSSSTKNLLSAENPARIIFFYHPDGVFLEQWQPEASSGAITNLPESLLPLGKFSDQMLIFRHLNLLDGNGDGHEESSRLLLTGDKRAATGSLDVLTATAFNDVLIHAGVLASKSGGSSVSFFPGGAEKVANDNPLSLYQRLFSNPSSSDNQQDEQLLGLVKDELSRYINTVQVDLEKNKLQQHLKQIELLMQNNEKCQGYDLSQFEFKEENKWDDKAAPIILRMQMLNLLTAFSCGMSRVATIQFSRHTSPIKMNYDWLDRWNDTYPMESHQASHNSGAIHAQQKKWINTQIAYFLDAMHRRAEPTPDREGSMLDHSLVVVLSEISQGASHSRVDMPFYIAGGKAIEGYNTGRILDCAGAPHTQLLYSLQTIMGQTPDGSYAGAGMLNGFRA